MLFRVIKIILISFAVRFHSVTDRFPRFSFQERLAAFFSWPYWAWLAHVSAVSTETNYCCRPVVALVTLQRAYSRVQFFVTNWTEISRSFVNTTISCDLYSTWSFFFFFLFSSFFISWFKGVGVAICIIFIEIKF